VDGFGEVVHVGGGDTGHRDAPVLGEVDVVLLGELVNLRGGEPGEAEHADLVGDVIPALLAAELLKAGTELHPHGDNAVSHQLDLLVPKSS